MEYYFYEKHELEKLDLEKSKEDIKEVLNRLKEMEYEIAERINELELNLSIADIL